MKLLHLEGEEVLVYNVDGAYFATTRRCTHEGAPLEEGELQGKMIICPWHGSCFDVTTGAVTCGPATRPLRTYRVAVEGEVGRVEENVVAGVEGSGAAGVRHLFSLSGNQILAIYDATIGRDLAIIQTRHEAAAVHWPTAGAGSPRSRGWRWSRQGRAISMRSRPCTARSWPSPRWCP